MTRKRSTELPRWSERMQQVMDVMSDGQEWYGVQLTNVTGIPSGTLYPILTRLTQLGILTARWEDVDTRGLGRPRRRYYRRLSKFPVTGARR